MTDEPFALFVGLAAALVFVLGMAAGNCEARSDGNKRALECVEADGDPAMCRKAAGVEQ